MVIGSFAPAHADRVAALYAPLGAPIVRTTVPTAEMVKYAANAFLATKISFINEIANICERIGGDARQVAEGIGLDHRIGRDFLHAGIGWGGSCFKKDILALQRTAEEYGYTSELLQATVEVNRRQRLVIVQKLQEELKILKGKRIGLLGLAFKPHTDDLRDAPSLTIVERLQAAGASVAVHDPVVTDIGPLNELVRFAADPVDLATGADAVVLVTEWPQYGDLDWDKIAAAMRTGVVVDGRNALDPAAVEAAGLRYRGIARG